VEQGFSADDGIIGDILASWHSLAPVLKMYLDRSTEAIDAVRATHVIFGLTRKGDWETCHAALDVIIAQC
jgi:hypothetical protein